MGAKQTKVEGSYLPDTPKIQQIKLCTLLKNEDDANLVLPLEKRDVNELDPRSPSGCRTPLKYNQEEGLHEAMGCSKLKESALSALGKRWLKSFTYNLNDPRSPNAGLNRTPLIFDETRTFNMNDTFADLFIASRATPDTEIQYFEIDDEIQKDCENNDVEREVKIEESVSLTYEGLPETPKDLLGPFNSTSERLQQKIDPRSPTLGVERTPIILNDDDEEEHENVVLENILATLSLDLSASSSISLFGKPVSLDHEVKHIPKIRNKHLERVQTSKKRTKVTMNASQYNRCIYEDNDIENVPTTPKQKKFEGKIISRTNNGKRTPLSCVKNRSSIRSRSVEISEKSLKARVSLRSYDDNLNPKECSKVTNVRFMQKP